jgi:2,4-dienoyl-CoA reductase-like NADH-dependent reductase (Old Yellow Enzyme family)
VYGTLTGLGGDVFIIDDPQKPVDAQSDARRNQLNADGRCDLVALAREMMWNPNWPVHAAKVLGRPDPLDLLPKTYAWWLRRREQVRKLYPTGNESP